MLTSDFVLTRDRWLYAVDHGVPDHDVKRQFKHFHKVNRNERGDWDVAWQFWCLTAGETYGDDDDDDFPDVGTGRYS